MLFSTMRVKNIKPPYGEYVLEVLPTIKESNLNLSLAHGESPTVGDAGRPNGWRILGKGHEEALFFLWGLGTTDY